MLFKVEVGEDGYVKNKEIVAILGAIFIVLLLYCTGQDPRLAVLCCYVAAVSIALYLINIFVKVAKFTYKKAYSVFLRLHGKHVQVVDLRPSCAVDAQVLCSTETTSVAVGAVEPLPLGEIANVPRVEDEFVYVVEPEALMQCASVDEEEIAPPIQPDSLLVEQVDEISFVSLDETRAALRAEAYLEVEHAAAYLGLPVESFNRLAKKKSMLPFKKCGLRYLYKINDLNDCAEKMSSYAWTKQINSHNQEKIISEHGLLTTENVAIFLNKSEKTLSNWRDTRENSSNEPYGPDFIKVNTSVFYNMRVLLEWCDSPLADKRKPRRKRFD